MAIPKTVRDGKITLKDGGTTTLIIAYEGEGNFSFDGAGEKASRLTLMDRGTIVGCRKENDQVITASFSVNMCEFTDSSAGSPIDFIMKTNAYSGNTSTGGSGFSDFYMVNVSYVSDGTAHGEPDKEVVLAKCIGTYEFSEGFPNIVTFNFECYGGITRT